MFHAFYLANLISIVTLDSLFTRPKREVSCGLSWWMIRVWMGQYSSSVYSPVCRVSLALFPGSQLQNRRRGHIAIKNEGRNGLRIRPEDLSIKSQQRIVNSSKIVCCLLSPLCCRQHPCSWPFGGGTSKISVLDIVWQKNHTNRILEFCIRGSYSGIDNVVVQDYTTSSVSRSVLYLYQTSCFII